MENSKKSSIGNTFYQIRLYELTYEMSQSNEMLCFQCQGSCSWCYTQDQEFHDEVRKKFYQQHLDSKEEEDFAMNRSSFVNEDVTTSNFQRQGHEIFRLFGGREISCTYQLLQWRGDFSLISYMFEFFHVAQYTTSFVTYYSTYSQFATRGLSRFGSNFA